MERGGKLDEILMRECLPRLRERYKVKSLGVFGSYARGEEREGSDIRLENELTEILGIKVDLVMKSALKPRIGKRILSEVVQLRIPSDFNNVGQHRNPPRPKAGGSEGRSPFR